VSIDLDSNIDKYLTLYTDFSDTDASHLSLGYRKIYIKKILLVEEENKFTIFNDRYKFKGGLQVSNKPISKIVK
jgi:hypothetical protein